MTTYSLAKKLVQSAREKSITVATAESCTGGLIAKLITDVPGSSAVLLGGCVTYTNEIKTALLGVDPDLIERESEVSHACARAMAQGAKERLGSTLAVSTTGYAGPGGGTDSDPVGTVYLALSSPGGTQSRRFSAPTRATRAQVRNAAAREALEWLLEEIEQMDAVR